MSFILINYKKFYYSDCNSFQALNKNNARIVTLLKSYETLKIPYVKANKYYYYYKTIDDVFYAYVTEIFDFDSAMEYIKNVAKNVTSDYIKGTPNIFVINSKIGGKLCSRMTPDTNLFELLLYEYISSKNNGNINDNLQKKNECDFENEENFIEKNNSQKHFSANEVLEDSYQISDSLSSSLGSLFFKNLKSTDFDENVMNKNNDLFENILNEHMGKKYIKNNYIDKMEEARECDNRSITENTSKKKDDNSFLSSNNPNENDEPYDKENSEKQKYFENEIETVKKEETKSKIADYSKDSRNDDNWSKNDNFFDYNSHLLRKFIFSNLREDYKKHINIILFTLFLLVVLLLILFINIIKNINF